MYLVVATPAQMFLQLVQGALTAAGVFTGGKYMVVNFDPSKGNIRAPSRPGFELGTYPVRVIALLLSCLFRLVWILMRLQGVYGSRDFH